MKASGISAMPISRSRTPPSCRKRIAAKIAPVPQNALARVNQSARWNSRSMEKWRGLGRWLDMGRESREFGSPSLPAPA